MALFTSVQSGNWEDGATWGNTSPGVAGTDYPGVTDDDTIISADHTVTCDIGDSSVVFGYITISGTLNIPYNADTTLRIGLGNNLTINTTGVMNIGDASNDVSASNTVQILFTGGSVASADLIINGGFNAYGNAAKYGTLYALLDSDWTSGQTFYVTGDRTSDWASGHKLVIHKNTTYSSYVSDIQLYTIDTITYDSGNNRTAITIVEAAPGLSFYKDNYGWNSRVLNVTRNIIITPIDSYTWDTTSVTSSVSAMNAATSFNVYHTAFIGFYSFMLGQTMTGCYMRNREQSFTSSSPDGSLTDSILWSGANATCLGGSSYDNPISNVYVMGANYGLGGYLDRVSGVILVACSSGVYNTGILGDFIAVSCNKVSYYTGFNSYYVQAYGCNYGISSAGGALAGKLLGALGEDGGLPTSYRGHIGGSGISFSVAAADQMMITGKFEYSTLTYLSLYEEGYLLLYDCWENSDYRKFRKYCSVGYVDSITASDTNWQTPPSGQEWALEYVPNSNAQRYKPLSIGHGAGAVDNKVWIPDTITEVGVNIYPFGWTSSMPLAEFVFYIDYPSDSVGNYERVWYTQSGSLTQNQWNELVLTIAPAKAGWIFWDVCLGDDDGQILVDPELTYA